MSDLTCRELIEFLDAYVAEELPPDRRAAFDAHLGICRDCRAYLSEYRRSIALVHALRDQSEKPAADSGVPEGLVRAILTAVRKR